MSEQIIKYGSENQQSIEQFQMLLNQHPGKDEVNVNKMANNSQYLPIASIEILLDELYSGLWQAVNFRWQNVANEIIGSIDLQVFHPVAKVWITRTGAASVMIQTARDQEVILANKIKNTLVKDFPHLKTECIKNAAKSLGSRFGRNLNRGADEDVMYLSEIVSQLSENGQQAYELLKSSNLEGKALENMELKIKRANPETMTKIVEYLKTKQNGN